MDYVGLCGNANFSLIKRASLPCDLNFTRVPSLQIALYETSKHEAKGLLFCGGGTFLSATPEKK